MEYWNTAWKCDVGKQPYQYTHRFQTEISSFENGKEQRRKKLSTPKRRFVLAFNALTEAEVTAIKAFFDARYGAFDAFYFPNEAEVLVGTRLALVEGGASKDTITDSSSGFLDLGFAAGQKIMISGSTAGNSGHYELYAAAAGTLTLIATDDITAESANAALRLYKTYKVRFESDDFDTFFKTDDNGYVGNIGLIEDLNA